MHSYFGRVLVRQHLFSERFVHWGQDLFDRLTSIRHEELRLSSSLVTSHKCRWMDYLQAIQLLLSAAPASTQQSRGRLAAACQQHA